MKKKKDLQLAWTKRLRLQAEGRKLRAEGRKLLAKSDKLWEEGVGVWRDAIVDKYGYIKIEWKNWSDKKQGCECHLGNGEIYRP